MKMRYLLMVAFAMFSANPATAETRPNVLLIAIDDLRNDLGSLGVEYAKTPQLDGFADTARIFSHHYVQVPTCGASRCALMRGCYPSVAAQVGNNGIKETQRGWAMQSLPSVFRQNGYRTLALGKITHYPGGLTGKEWNEGPEELPGVWDRCWIPKGPWKTAESIMHGYANGVARQPGKSLPMEAHDGPDDAYPDAWVASEAIQTLHELASNQQPWFFGVGFFKPHLPFAAPKKWYDLHAAGVPDLLTPVASKPTWPSNWHNSGEFRNNYRHEHGRNPDQDIEYARQMRRAYAASLSYMDAQVGRVLASLQKLGMDKNTIVVVWSDHGFLLGEHSIWGKHCLYERALQSPLMIRYPGMIAPGKTSAATVETVDVLPTLVDLCGLPETSGKDGVSLRPQLTNPSAPSSKSAHSFWTGGLRSVRNDRFRLIEQPGKNGAESQLELFDYLTDPDETRNLAQENLAVVRELQDHLRQLPNANLANTSPGKPNK